MSVVRSPAGLVGFRAGGFYRMDFAAAAARICCFRCSVWACCSIPVNCSGPKGLRRKRRYCGMAYGVMLRRFSTSPSQKA